MRLFRRFVGVVAAVMCVFLALSIAAAGQTTKKKKKTTKRPATVKTSAQKTGDASVVSLADQYQDSSSKIIQPTPSLAASDITLPDETSERLRDLQTRIKNLERQRPTKPTYEDKQKILLANLDILTKAEQRAESLRRQRFELVEKENTIRIRLDQIDVDIRPEMIERSVAMAGSLRPEELREARQKSLTTEKQNLTNMLNEITMTKTRLEQDVLKAEALVDKIRVKLEKDIDDALSSDQPDGQ